MKIGWFEGGIFRLGGGSQPGGQRGQTDGAGHPQELALHGHEAYLE